MKTDPRSGDFNGDGVADLVEIPNRVPGVEVLLGKGDGSFLPGYLFPLCAPANATSDAVGDFDGDGKDDIAATCGGVAILLNRSK